jgi:hypothetical protein
VVLLLNWNYQLGVALIGRILGLAHLLLFCIYVIRQEHGNDMITFIAGILIMYRINDKKCFIFAIFRQNIWVVVI